MKKQQKRWFTGRFGGGYTAEEHYISSAYRRIQDKPPSTVVICERIQLVGCNLLPRMAQSMIERAQHRFRVITHADTVSMDVLKHQIAFVEEQERRNNYRYPTAIFFMNLNNAETIKQKHMVAFADAIAGSLSLADLRTNVVVCGIPNSGKSSLIMALTRVRTLEVKKKKDYHLPKISSQAGRTLGTKTHVMAYGNRQKTEITFMDSPGLRPRLEELDVQTIRLLLATKTVEPFKNYVKFMPNNELLQILLLATNNYSQMNYELGMMLRSNKSKTVNSGKDQASPPLPDYVSAFGLSEATDDPEVFIKAYYKTTREKVSKDPMHLVRKWQAGDFGSWLLTPFRRDCIANANMASMNDIQRNSPIVYMNAAAQEYIKRAPDFINMRMVKNVQGALNEQVLRKTG
jgi:50S ribosome-binding GTPase